MEIAIEPSKLPQAVPIGLFEKHFIGSAENNGESFDVYLGLDENLASQLQKYSLDTSDADLQKNTSDYERFGKGSYEEWYSRGRVPFALVHRDTGALAALVWFGPKALGTKSLKHVTAKERESENLAIDSNWHTIAFRSYSPFRGGGIMKAFTIAVTQVYRNYFPQARLWTSNTRTNIPSVKLSEKLGYRIDESLSDKETVTMVLQ
jgi:hypothetical protein